MNEQDLKDLARLRNLIDKQGEHVKELDSELQETVEYRTLQIAKNFLSEYKAEADELTAKIKADSLAEYLATKEKPTLKGLALRVNHSLKYDLNSVTEWAKENAKMLFKLDVKAFEKMATTTIVPGVEIVDEPTITIAADLSEYLS